MPSSAFYGSFLTHEQIDIGRLVTEREAPARAFWPPNKSVFSIPRESISKGEFSVVTQKTTVSKSSKFFARVTKILGLKIEPSAKWTEAIKSETVVYLELLNPDTYIRQLCEHASAKSWIAATIQKKSKIFVVIGLLVYRDATVASKSGTFSKADANAALPAGAMVTAVVPPLAHLASTDKLDLSLGIGRHATKKNAAEFTANGDRIVGALFYRLKVKHRNGNKSDIDSELSLKGQFLWFDKERRGEEDTAADTTVYQLSFINYDDTSDNPKATINEPNSETLGGDDEALESRTSRSALDTVEHPSVGDEQNDAGEKEESWDDDESDEWSEPEDNDENDNRIIIVDETGKVDLY